MGQFWIITIHYCLRGWRGIKQKKSHWGGVHIRKIEPARVLYRDDSLILYHVYMMMGHFIFRLFEGTLLVDKIHVQFKITNITHAPSLPVHLQTDITPKQVVICVVVSRLHDTGAKFCTGVKFSLWYNNHGELTPRWLSPEWHFMLLSCKQI